MSRTVCFKVSSGMDSVIRVLATLRRKNFNVTEMSMREVDGAIELSVSVDDLTNPGFDRAVLHVKRLVDVFDIAEVQ
jgi:acetolactate synthase regulatory subunit